MNKRWLFLQPVLFSLLLFSFLACEKDLSPLSTEYSLNLQNDNWVLITPHFQLFATDIDHKNIFELGQTLEQNYPRIMGDLQPDQTWVTIVRLYPDFTSFRAAIGMPGAPPWVIGVSYTEKEIRIMSPNSPELGPGYPYDFMLQCLVHEFVHCVTLNINRSIPRWLFEGTALFEAGQFVNPRNLSYVVSGNYPTLSELNSNWTGNVMIYEVGYVLVEYIVNDWNIEALRNLIRHGGNIPIVLGISVAEFENGWYAFIEDKYL